MLTQIEIDITWIPIEAKPLEWSHDHKKMTYSAKFRLGIDLLFDQKET